jgi:integrase
MPRGAAVIPYDGKRGRVWRIKYADATGRQCMETVGAERDGITRKVAEAELRERLVKVEGRGWRKPAPLTFAEYAKGWLEECKQRRHWRPRTVLVNEGAIARLEPFFGTLDSIRPRDVTSYVREALDDYAPATVNLDVSVLVDVLNSAIREELIETNPALHAERPKIPRRRWRILEPIEVALPKRLMDELAEHWQRSAFRGDEELVFPHPERGTLYRADVFRAALSAALAAAGVDGRVRPFHDLRHTAITNDAASGSNPIAVMTKAGHSDMKTTKRYMHLAGVVFRDEAERLEKRLLGAGPSFLPRGVAGVVAHEPVDSSHHD